MALLSTVSRSNWNLKCWFLWREENRSTRRKTIGAGTRTNNKLNPHDAETGNWTQATLVGGKRSYHCPVPAFLKINLNCDIHADPTLHIPSALQLCHLLWWFDATTSDFNKPFRNYRFCYILKFFPYKINKRQICQILVLWSLNTTIFKNNKKTINKIW